MFADDIEVEVTRGQLSDTVKRVINVEDILSDVTSIEMARFQANVTDIYQQVNSYF